MKVAIVGSREFSDLGRVMRLVESLSVDVEVISGGARGVDGQAAACALRRGLKLTVIKPDYAQHPPKLAPLMRNRTIAEQCDRMVAFWDGLSGGTANAIAWAAALKKPVLVFRAGSAVEGAE